MRIVVECDLKDVTDVEGIATDEIAAKLLDLSGNGAIAVVLAIGLAPSDHAGVGLDPHENEILPPAGMDRMTFDPDDFHDAPYCVNDRSRGDFLWVVCAAGCSVAPITVNKIRTADRL